MTCTRRQFLTTAGVAGACVVGRVSTRPARAQSPRLISVSHSVSTFVYGQHLVAREKAQVKHGS
jgi:hypothetical protein